MALCVYKGEKIFSSQLCVTIRIRFFTLVSTQFTHPSLQFPSMVFLLWYNQTIYWWTCAKCLISCHRMNRTEIFWNKKKKVCRIFFFFFGWKFRGWVSRTNKVSEARKFCEKISFRLDRLQKGQSLSAFDCRNETLSWSCFSGFKSSYTHLRCFTPATPLEINHS